MKHIKYTLLLLLMFLFGCNKEEWAEPKKGILATVSTHYANSLGMQTSTVDNTVKTLSGYICEGGSVKWLSHELKNSTENILLPAQYKNSTLYLVANKNLCPDIDLIVVGSSESALIGLTATLNEYMSPTSLLMTNVISVAALLDKESSVINLKRNVARLDLSVNDKVILHSITIKGIPVSGSVFSGEANGGVIQTESKTLTYDSGNQPSALQTLLYCQELAASAQAPLTISIDASYNGIRAQSQATIGAIQRNYIYRLLISAPNGIITSDIMYGDLENGDDVTLDKPNQTSFYIDSDKSEIPLNCKLSDDNKQLIFDSRGGQAIIALGGTNEAVKLISKHSSIRDFSVTPQEDGRFLIRVGSYGTEIAGYTPAAVMYFAKEKEADDPSCYKAITVTEKYYAPFDFVKLGGAVWMKVNSNSINPNDYLTTEINQDYKQLYVSNWKDFSAKGFQWGPRPGHATKGYIKIAAWEEVFFALGFFHDSLPVANGTIIDGNNCKSWDGFCPEGWRLPMFEEFEHIWPPQNTTIPVGSNIEYTTSYGSFTARIENLGNNCLIINDGINELIFPIAGFRISNGVANNEYTGYGWNVGTEARYWCNDRVNANGRTYGIKPTNISEIREENAANWNQIRCVRDTTE